jgi:type I restriction enzyme S subunit
MIHPKDEEFKDSEVGKIPKEWGIRKINDIFNVETGTTPSTKRKDYWEDGNIEWITPADMSKIKTKPLLPPSNRKITERALKETNLTLMPKNSIILSTRAPVGYVGLVDNETTFNQGCKGLIPKEQVDTLFYCYYLLFQRPKLEVLSGGSTFKELSKNLLENFGLLYLPLGEQRKIALILSTIDEAIQKVDLAIAKTERLKKGLMQRLLTKGIGHREFRDTEIGRIPKEWKVITLGEVIDEIKNGFASGKRDENGIVQIRMNNVTTDGRLIFNSYLKVPIPENVDGWILKRGDFLFNNTNSYDLVGKSTIFTDTPFPCTFSNHFTRIRFKKEVLPELILHHFIRLWEKSYFKSVAIRHVGQSAVHTGYLLKLQLPLPPLPEQQKIVEILSIVDMRLELERERREKLEKIKKGLMNDLLTGKKRVKA